MLEIIQCSATASDKYNLSLFMLQFLLFFHCTYVLVISFSLNISFLYVIIRDGVERVGLGVATIPYDQSLTFFEIKPDQNEREQKSCMTTFFSSPSHYWIKWTCNTIPPPQKGPFFFLGGGGFF